MNLTDSKVYKNAKTKGVIVLDYFETYPVASIIYQIYLLPYAISWKNDYYSTYPWQLRYTVAILFANFRAFVLLLSTLIKLLPFGEEDKNGNIEFFMTI